MSYLLDTNFIIDLLRKRKGIEKEVLDLFGKEELLVSVVTYAELVYGCHRARKFVQETEKITDLFNGLQIKTISLDKKIVEIYAKVRFDLEKQGQRLDDFDLLIGATAVASRSWLVTRNKKHFERFTGLKLYVDGD